MTDKQSKRVAASMEREEWIRRQSEIEVFWADLEQSEKERGRLFLLSQYAVYGRPRDRRRIEEVAAAEGREIYVDEDHVFAKYETPAQTAERRRLSVIRLFS